MNSIQASEKLLSIHLVYRGNLTSEVENFLRIDGNQSIPQRLADCVRINPDKPALVEGRWMLSFSELDRHTNQLGRLLIHDGLLPGDRVGLLFGHSPASIIAIYAVLKAGGVYVPLDRDYPAKNLEHMVLDAGLKWIITDGAGLALAERLLPKDGIALNIDEVDPGLSVEKIDLDIPANSIAGIIYTSGTTGQPKGIVKRHNALHHRPYGFGPGDCQAFLTSFAVSMALSTIFGALLSGVTICFFPVRERGINKLGEWLNENNITVFYPPVSLFNSFVDALQPDDFFSHLRLVQLAGQRVSADHIQTFRKHISSGCFIKHLLASSEAGASTALIITPETVLDKGDLPVGYPTVDKQVLILDEEGQPLGFDQLGEIAVKGRYVASGYWGAATANTEKFIPDPTGSGETLILTGDLGLIRPDGMLEFHGRKDEMVKISGYRVEFSLIEEALRKLPGVDQAAVAALDTGTGDQRLVAYLTSINEGTLQTGELRRALEAVLPPYMIPSQFALLTELPHTPNGKIDRSALGTPAPETILRDNPYIPPRNNLESQLAKIWERFIGVHPIGVQDDFFAVGGNSLGAMRIFVEIERLVGKRIPLTTILNASTIEMQARLLESQDWVADWSSLVAVQEHGSQPPLFCFPGVGGNVLNFHDLSYYLGDDQPCYALQSKGIGGQEEPLTHIEQIASLHLEAIKTVQPKGPYYLCGSSFGGRVAYELAQQLHDHGDEIALVAMFDTYGPGYPKRIKGNPKAKVWLNRRGQKLKKHLVNLNRLDFQGKREYMRTHFPKMGDRFSLWIQNQIHMLRYPLPADLKKVRKANKLANKHTVLPPRFGGRLVLFKASQQPYGLAPDETMGWGSVAGERIEVIVVEGHHDGLLWEPQVRGVAHILQRLLKETSL